VRFLAICYALFLFAPAAVLAQTAPPGPVVLTVSGDVGKSNRGALDKFADKLPAVQGLTFERGMTFDLAGLERLGMRELKVKYDSWPAEYRFEGPLLRDVLAAAGVSDAKIVRPVALDGYTAEIPYSDLSDYPVILALKRDGKWLGIGETGPAWVIYPRQDYPALAKEDDAKWVWGVFHIQVEGKPAK
jgi:hypothetical protein